MPMAAGAWWNRCRSSVISKVSCPMKSVRVHRMPIAGANRVGAHVGTWPTATALPSMAITSAATPNVRSTAILGLRVAAVRQAIAATTGRVLSWQGAPISTVYHASNGGVMATGPEAWSMASALLAPPVRTVMRAGWQRHPIAISVEEAAVAALLAERAGGLWQCNHPRFRWTRSYGAAWIRQALGEEVPGLDRPIDAACGLPGVSGRVLALQIPALVRRPRWCCARSHPADPAPLAQHLFVMRTPQGRCAGWCDGGGFGHGAGSVPGRCHRSGLPGLVHGANSFHYYPGTVYGPLPATVQSPLESCPPEWLHDVHGCCQRVITAV